MNERRESPEQISLLYAVCGFVALPYAGLVIGCLAVFVPARLLFDVLSVRPGQDAQTLASLVAAAGALGAVLAGVWWVSRLRDAWTRHGFPGPLARLPARARVTALLALIALEIGVILAQLQAVLAALG